MAKSSVSSNAPAPTVNAPSNAPAPMAPTVNAPAPTVSAPIASGNAPTSTETPTVNAPAPAPTVSAPVSVLNDSNSTPVPAADPFAGMNADERELAESDIARKAILLRIENRKKEEAKAADEKFAALDKEFALLPAKFGCANVVEFSQLALRFREKGTTRPNAQVIVGNRVVDNPAANGGAKLSEKEIECIGLFHAGRTAGQIVQATGYSVGLVNGAKAKAGLVKKRQA